MSFEEIINNGINNPECAFFVGMWVGKFIMLKIMFGMVVGYGVIKIINALALEPLLNWIKKKLKFV